ncbi:MAG: AraC family transcriptional regulator [Acidobacteriota bacterium]
MRLHSGIWYGNTLSTDSVGGLTLTETVYNSNLKLPHHSHEQAYFCLVLKGSYTESYGRKSRICKRATLVFHPADEPHADHFHSLSHCFNIQMNEGWVARMRPYPLELNEPQNFQGGLLPHLAMRLYQEFRQADELSSLIVEGIALEMMGEAGRNSIKKFSEVPPPWLSEARDLLHEHFTEHLSLREQAEVVGVHPVHLAREFRRFYHCTVGDYVRRLRIEFACEKLAKSDAPLSEIALAAGFFDQSHFTRTFKQYTGNTPQHYRASFR